MGLFFLKKSPFARDFAGLSESLSLGPAFKIGGILNIIGIEIINWAKYNPRTDSKKPTWFRVDNDLATGPGFHGLDCEHKWLWIIILSLVSQKNGQQISWNFGYVESISGIKKKKQIETIEMFEQFSRLRVSREVTSRYSPATNERTNVTNETGRDVQGRVAAPTSDEVRAEASLPKELSEVHEFLNSKQISIVLIETWLQSFPEPDWIIQELKKANVWEIANPRKKKKDFGRFMTNWLTKGWDERRMPRNSGMNRATQRETQNRSAAEAYMAKLKAKGETP